MNRLLPGILIFLATVTGTFGNPGDIAPDRIFIKYEAHQPARQASITEITGQEPLLSSEHSSRLRIAGDRGIDRIYVATIEEGENPAEIARKVGRNASVEYAEPVPVYRPQTSPNDPRYDQQDYLSLINARQAWEITTGSPETVIAIIDTGTDIDHEDLEANTWHDETEDIHGWDFWNDDSDPRPGSSAHGTHVAGIAAAVTDNGEGIASLGHSVSYMPLRVSGGSGSTISGEAAYEAMVYAAEKGADVINCSWGGSQFSRTAAEVIATVYEEGPVIVAAAGNDGTEQPIYPAGYSEVIGVASAELNRERSAFSNYGPHVDVMAPGTNILSTIPGDAYSTSSGTSMAAPVVSALAGLIRSEDPGLTNDQVRARIQASAGEPEYNREDEWYRQLGEGIIDAAAALQEARPYLQAWEHRFTEVGSEATAKFEPGTEIDLHINWKNLGTGLENAEIAFESLSGHLDDDLIAFPSSDNLSLGEVASGENLNPEPITVEILGLAKGRSQRRAVVKASVYENSTKISRAVFDFVINPEQITLDVNTIELTIGDGGRLGYQDIPETVGGAYDYSGVSSFILGTFGTQQVDERWENQPLLREGGLMFADLAQSSDSRVSNNLRYNSNHFVVRENFNFRENIAEATQEATINFTDGDAGAPYDIITELKAHAAGEEAQEQFILLQYRFTNEGDEELPSFQPGLFLDWVLPFDPGNPLSLQETATGDYEHQDGIVYAKEYNQEQPLVTGATTVEPPGLAVLIDNSENDINNSFGTTGKFDILTRGISPLETEDAVDLSMAVGPEPFSLAPGETGKVTYILGWGIGYEELAENLRHGRSVAEEILHTPGEELAPELPEQSQITSTYPNPFNPATTIEFEVAEAGRYTIDVYNTLGQNLMQLEARRFTEGTHSVRMEAGNLTAGVYHLVLRRGSSIVDTRAITLLK